MIISKYDQVFIMVAKSFSNLAQCTHRNVGAVIVGEDGSIYGHGYNKQADRYKSCIDGGCLRGQLPAGQGASDYSDCITVHAEVNAMVMAGATECEGSTLYTTSMPCQMCFRVAEGHLVRRVVWSLPESTMLYEKQFY